MLKYLIWGPLIISSNLYQNFMSLKIFYIDQILKKKYYTKQIAIRQSSWDLNLLKLHFSLIKLLFFLMIQYKNKQANKLQAPFPFSAYVLRSYSSEPTDKSRAQQRSKNNNQGEREQQQFYGLIKGWGLKENQIQLLHQFNQHSMKNAKQEMIEQIKIKAAECQSKLRKNLYRTRDFKVAIPKSLSPVKKKHITDNKSLQSYFRYQIVSLFTLLNRKEDFVNSLRGKKQLMANPMKSNQLEQKLEKLLESKGKDKGRVKFNHVTNQQLRSIKYKSKVSNMSNNSTSSASPKKQSRIHDDQQQQQEGVEEQKVDNMDLQTWKRKNGVGFYQKIFIVKGGYADLRKALIERGWYENDDVWSPHFDFKWTTRICDINYLNLRNHQSVNHFNNNHHLTSKYGITRRLRTLILGHNVDADKFYPRCYDLGDQVDFQNFVENFKFSFAESVAKRFLVDKKRYEKLELKIRITVDILKRRSLSFYSKINEINKGNFLTISSQQWQIITQTTEMSDQEKEDRLKQIRKKDSQNNVNIQTSVQDPQYQQKLFEFLHEKIILYLETLKKNDPQIIMNGFRNVWIVKPNFMSRGRGIRCFNNLYDIADYCLGQNIQFVVQKYIEHPLVIEGKKFDIRQWVLIQDFNPPKIWFYNQCYLRFCADQFSLDNIYNRFIHLTNNSVQKYNKKGNIEKSMWTMGELAEYLGEEKWLEVQTKIKNIVVWSIKSCEGHVIGRKGSYQLVGYDFMIDENLDPWLIQINMSPSMDYSTPVTKKLVKMVLTDTAKVMSSNKKTRDTGGFQCIYRGTEDLSKYDLYNF